MTVKQSCLVLHFSWQIFCVNIFITIWWERLQQCLLTDTIIVVAQLSNISNVGCDRRIAHLGLVALGCNSTITPYYSTGNLYICTSIILIRVLCLSVCVSLCLSVCLSVSREISWMEHCITVHLLPAQRASPVEFTNRLTTSLLKRKVVNAPFAFLCISTCCIRNHAHHIAHTTWLLKPAICLLLHGKSVHAHFGWSKSFASCVGQVPITNTPPLKHEEAECSRRLVRSTG